MKRGVSLIEIMIVMAILAILSMILVGTLDPGALVGRANDSRRKKDIGRIKVSLEEYYNDKGCYPVQTMLDGLVCGGNGFAPWLQKWPCDPNGEKYVVGVGPSGSDCPSWYRVLTNLENLNDPAIPLNWYKASNVIRFADGLATVDEVNHGVSSTNIDWYDKALPATCNFFRDCYRGEFDANGALTRCDPLTRDTTYNNVYADANCSGECFMDCCYNGEICN